VRRARSRPGWLRIEIIGAGDRTRRGTSQGAGGGLPAAKAGEYHTVKKGETLYSIALEHGQSYRDVAAWNNIDNPSMIRVGQQLRVVPPEGVAVARPIDTPAAVEVRPLATSRPQANTEALKREPKGGKQPYTEQAMAAVQKDNAARSEPPPAAAIKPEPRPTEAPAGTGELNWAWPSGGQGDRGLCRGRQQGHRHRGPDRRSRAWRPKRAK
jgi:lipoprotein NlpD